MEEVKRKLDRIWRFVESTNLNMTDASERILEHRHRRKQLEAAAEEARAVLAQRREVPVSPGKATIIYTIPTPEDSPIEGADAAEIARNGGVQYWTRWWARQGSNL